LPFSIQTITLDNGVEREAGFQPIRITPSLMNDRIDASLPTDLDLANCSVAISGVAR